MLVLVPLLLPHFSQAVSLSLPEKTPVPAQAEVSAVKSPVKLTLSVYKTELKLKDDFRIETDFERLWKEHPMKDDKYDWENIDEEKYLRRVPIKIGAPLWIKISLKNVGKKTMFVMDDLFTGPKDFQQALKGESYYGVKVIITGPDGKDVPWNDLRYISGGSCPELQSTFDPVGTVKAAKWRKEGLTKEQIDDRLNNEAQEEVRKKKKREQSQHPIKRLEPGETIATRPWRYQGRCKEESGLYPPQVGDFAQLWNFHLDTPGVYTIRAIYFDDPYSRHKKEGADIRFHTPPIKVTVLP